jgi:hypothetical protein
MPLVPGIEEKGSLASRGAAMTHLMPNPYDTDVQYSRFHHHDLANSETKELLHELYALRPFLWWRLRNNPWLQERVKVIEAELAKRRNRRGQGMRGG